MRQSVQRKFLLDDVGALGCIQRMREGLHRRSRPVHLPLHQIVHCHCHHRHFLCAVCRECNSGGGGTENGFSLLLRLGGAREGVRDVGRGSDRWWRLAHSESEGTTKQHREDVGVSRPPAQMRL
jgi:hypothetical protein